MDFMYSYRKISSKLFNKFSEKHLDDFRSIHRDLRMASMPIMLREYLSMCFLTAVLTPIATFPATFFLIYFFFGKALLISILLSAGITAGATGGMFIGALKYPATVANERKRNIDNNLPFATLYMNTIAGTGAPPYLIFKLLSDFKEYGEVSREAQKIVEDVEVMGQDIELALQRVAEETPSVDLKDLFWAMITTIVRGGDLRTLLQEKSKMLMDSYRRKVDEYTDTVSTYVEVYITLVIVGSIFGLVMTSIMGTISGGFENIRAVQEILVFVFLPMSAIVFIILLKLTSPVG